MTAARVPLGSTGLEVFPLQLGGNTLGFTADAATSFDVLDAFVEAGGNSIDTADFYSAWAPGHSGGESERVIGAWLADRGTREDIVIATKMGMLEPYTTLDERSIRAALARSLERLQTDHVDLYYMHQDDGSTPVQAILETLAALTEEGLIRAIGASNFSAARLREAMDTAKRRGLRGFQVLQEDYSLVNRAGYEHGVRDVALEYGITTVPYRSLAKGFLSGRYRPGRNWETTTHTAVAVGYLERFGGRLLEELERIADAHSTTMSAIGLAWVRSRPTIALPLTGVRTIEQLADVLPAANVTLTTEEAAILTTLTEPESVA
ncbi:MAG: aldo/keto reductase [Microbacteriaceae bacterium]